MPEPALVLIVDDHVTNLRLLGGVLESQGWRHLDASSGEEALELLASHRPDLVLLDIQMPGLSGTEVATKVRENPNWNGLRLVAVTALTMPGDREEILAAGFDDYIAKPFKVPELLGLVRKHLGSTRAASP